MFGIIIQSYKTSLKALLANKGRSFLTMLGIIIGVAAVIIIVSLGAGAQNLILSEVESFGTNVIGVLPGKSDDNGPPASVMGIVITTLTYEDAMALAKKKNVPDIISVVAYSNGVATLSWRANTYDTSLSGCSTGYLEVENASVAEGRFFTKEEETNLSRVVVLGSTVKEELFGSSEAVGQRIKIKKHMFDVIGVMKEQGTVAFQDYDDRVFIPIKTMQKIINGVNYLGMIRAKINNKENMDKAIEDMSITLRQDHDIHDSSGDSDDFTIRSSAQALNMVTTITNALKYFLAAMSALSLVVGGIGIMNIMLVNVTERTREIGLRKALGARSISILGQFLSEAIAVTLLGGIIGIISGSAVAYFVYLGAIYLGYDWVFVVSPTAIVLAVGVATFVGLIFGIYPAYKASLLEPVEALRYE